MYKLFIGTSGYNYREWRGKFYPPKLPTRDWLAFYAQTFDTVEINASFYGHIKREEYRRWNEQTPQNFRFAIKGHRYITQMKKLHEVNEAVNQFLDAASALEEKLSVILWQFPANFTLSTARAEEYKQRLRRFLDLLPRGIRQAFEFRDTSWFTDEIHDLLDKHHASLVISDSPKFPLCEMPSSDFAYVRFHGPAALYASQYSDAQLEQWAKKIQSYACERDVYCYFNNDLSGYAIQNTKTLRTLLTTARSYPEVEALLSHNTG
jgi:uncharacterized protein YecE (DUF72 family)